MTLYVFHFLNGDQWLSGNPKKFEAPTFGIRRIPVLVPHAAATAVPRVASPWLARRCLDDPSEEAAGSTSTLDRAGP